MVCLPVPGRRRARATASLRRPVVWVRGFVAMGDQRFPIASASLGRCEFEYDGVLGGVRVLGIVEDQSPLKTVYDPSHPDADADGYVQYPNVDTILEMADLIAASRAFEANLSVLEAGKQLITRTLTIGR